ncbi:MAG: B12-binding domain-containing radical SAM protein [Planctomycetaceae bacterium]|nr:B12-binding domain-containing radical SAM protein [Planctomycetaceae bacterium]
MNVLLVYSLEDIQSPRHPLWSYEQIQFGLSYIAAVLKQHGHAVSLVVISRRLGRDRYARLDQALREFQPALVGFSAISTEYDVIEQAAAHVRQVRPQAYQVIGGAHVSLNPSAKVLQTFDALCVGEGEYPLLELAGQLQAGRAPRGIANLWLRDGQDIEKNPPRAFLQDLDSLPQADREIWAPWIAPGSASRHSVLLGRGCPFQCTYCSNHALRKLADGPYVRMRSPENIVQEIRTLSEAWPEHKEFYLEVESFTANMPWALEVCRQLEQFNASRLQPLSFGVNMRVTPNVDFARLFQACRQANFRFVNIGLESGSPRVRSEVLKRNYTNEQVLEAVRAARANGLKICFFNLMGIPGETEEDFWQTVQMNRLCAPDWHHTSIFYPYPGTALHDLCVQQGLLKGPLDTRMERSRATLDLPLFSRRRIQHRYTWFDFYVSRGRKPLWKILARVLVMRCMSLPGAFALYRRLTQTRLLRRLKSAVKAD